MKRGRRGKGLKKVLIITYYYSPMESTGSYRNVAFAKYLPKYGFEPYIIAPVVNKKTWSGPIDRESESRERVFRVPGAELGAVARSVFGERLKGFGVTRADFRSKSSNLLKRFLGFCYDELLTFPDPQWPWYWMGRRKALEVAKRVEPDIILSSALPFSSHLLGAYVQHALNIPWVADYRDLWSKNHNRKRTKFIQRLEVCLEKRVLRLCAAATTVSEPLAEDLRELVRLPVHVVTNGFDPEEYDATKEDPPGRWESSRMNIVYTGMLYPGGEDPTALFQAFHMLLKSGAIRQGDIKVWFYGPNVEVIRKMVSFHGVEGFVELPGLVPRREALNCQKHADVLLLLAWIDSAARGVATRKLFEYLGAGKPILAVGPPGGVIGQTLEETGMGVLENDPLRLARIIQNLARKGSMADNRGPHRGRPDILKKFTVEYQTGVLARILESAIRRKGTWLEEASP